MGHITELTATTSLYYALIGYAEMLDAQLILVNNGLEHLRTGKTTCQQ